MRCSYLEIYCEDVRDLLGANQKKKLQVKERPDVGVYVKDLSAFVVRNADDMDKIMSKGNVNRTLPRRVEGGGGVRTGCRRPRRVERFGSTSFFFNPRPETSCRHDW